MGEGEEAPFCGKAASSPSPKPTPSTSQGFCVFGTGRGEGHTFCPRWAASRPSSNRGWRVVASLRAAFPPSDPSPNESPFPKQYPEQGFDNVKSFGKERGRFWGGEDDRMAPPERAVPVDASPRLTGIDSNAGSLSEERSPSPNFLSTQTRKYGPQNP